MNAQVRRARVGDRGPMLALWERSVRATHHFLEEADIVALRPLVAQELESDALEWPHCFRASPPRRMMCPCTHPHSAGSPSSSSA
jgi:hypothetical protein